MTRNPILNRLLGLTLGAFALMASPSATAEKLDLSEGTMFAKGIAGVGLQADDITKITADSWKGTAEFSWGYFVLDNLAVSFDVGVQGKFAPTGVDASRRFGAGINLGYYFDTDSIVRPYIQVGGFGSYGGGIGISNPALTTTAGWSAGPKAALGLLVGLNQHVALDFGVMGSVDFAISRAPATTILEAGVGFAGVRAFF